jgi:hypothetical protein
MATEEKVMTDEEARVFAEGRLASFEFMQNHLNDEEQMVRGPENASKMAAYLRTKKLAWTVENLEKAYVLLREAGELQLEPNPAVHPELEAPSAEIVPETYPWGPALTKQSFARLSGEEMRRWRNSAKWHAEFNNQFEALDLKITNLKKEY